MRDSNRKLTLVKIGATGLRKCHYESCACPSHPILEVAMTNHRHYLVKYTAAESLLVKTSEAVLLASVAKNTHYTRQDKTATRNIFLQLLFVWQAFYVNDKLPALRRVWNSLKLYMQSWHRKQAELIRHIAVLYFRTSTGTMWCAHCYGNYISVVNRRANGHVKHCLSCQYVSNCCSKLQLPKSHWCMTY